VCLWAQPLAATSRRKHSGTWAATQCPVQIPFICVITRTLLHYCSMHSLTPLHFPPCSPLHPSHLTPPLFPSICHRLCHNSTYRSLEHDGFSQIRYRPCEGHARHHTHPFLIRDLNRPKRPTDNHGRTGQVELGVGDGVLLKKLCRGKREFFHLLSQFLLFSKLYLFPDGVFFFNLFFPAVAIITTPPTCDLNGCVRHPDPRRVLRSQPPICSKSKSTRSVISQMG
jgi:hypothetical protein